MQMNPPRVVARSPMTPETRLFVVESTAMFSGRVAARVGQQSEIRLVGRTRVHPLVGERIEAVGPDVVLVDTGMAVGENLSVIRQIREKHPRLPLVIAVLEEGTEAVLDYFQGGANACLPSDVSAPDAVAALCRARQGEVACSPTIIRLLVRRLRETAPTVVSQQTCLSSREKEVLRLIAQGLLNKQIAHQLGIALCTVKNHTHNILKKLHVRHRRDAIDYAYKSGILRPGAAAGRRPQV